MRQRIEDLLMLRLSHGLFEHWFENLYVFQTGPKRCP